MITMETFKVDTVSPFSDGILTEPYEAHHQMSPYFKTLAFHFHDYYEIYLFLSGSISYYIENAGYNLQRGDVLIIPPGSMHRPVGTGDEAYERCYLWISGEMLRELQPEDKPFTDILESCSATNNYIIHFNEEQLKNFGGLFENVIAGEEDKNIYSDIANKSNLSLMFVEICRKICTDRAETDRKHKNGMIPQVIAFINEHITEELSLDELSEVFFISKYHLIREFKKYTNRTLYSYILSKRIILAKQLIQQDVPPTQACYKSGFNNYSNFYKAFIAETGMTPKDFIVALKQTAEPNFKKRVDKTAF